MSLFVVKDSRVGAECQTYPFKIRDYAPTRAKVAWECDSYADAVDWVQQMQEKWFEKHPQQEMAYLLARPYLSDIEFSIHMWRFIRAKNRTGFKGNIDALEWKYVRAVAGGQVTMLNNCYFCKHHLVNDECVDCPMVSCNKGGTLWFRVVLNHDVEACTKIINLLKLRLSDCLS